VSGEEREGGGGKETDRKGEALLVRVHKEKAVCRNFRSKKGEIGPLKKKPANAWASGSRKRKKRREIVLMV